MSVRPLAGYGNATWIGQIWRNFANTPQHPSGNVLAIHAGMHADEEVDREQIDSLVRGLMTQRRPLGAPVIQQAPGSPVESPQAEQRSVGRWSSEDLAIPTRRPRKQFTLPFEMPALAMPDLRRFITMPGQATIVRMWVGLGVLQAGSMVYWPYQKTYWGLVAYLMCLGVSLVNGVWGARLSWDARLGAAHTVSLGTVFWAATLAASEAVKVA